MILPDVNVLVYAHREDADDHARYRDWLEGVVNGPNAFALSDLVLSGFLRVVTHPRIFTTPTPTPRAREFARALRDAPGCARIEPGERHWSSSRGSAGERACAAI